MIRILSCIVLSLSALPMPLAPAAPSASPLPDTACVGCQGAGGGLATASGGSCGGSVSISVTMQPGTCKFVMTSEFGLFDCRPVKGCKPTVARSWSGLAAGSELDFCLTLEGQKFCLVNPPSAGTGSGSDTRDSASMTCDSGTSRTFSIESASCGLFAATQTTCSSCDGL